MLAVREFPLPSLSPSPLPPPWLSLVCQLVVILTPPPLVLSTLPQPQPLLINAPPPLVRWRISSHLPLFAGWLLRRLLSCRLRLASPFIAQPPLTSILDPPSSSAPAGCCVPSCRTASASRHAAGSRVASSGTFALNPPARPLSHRHFHRPLSQRHGHRRRPQMHGTLSRQRQCQRPLFPIVWFSSSNTSACAPAHVLPLAATLP